MTNGALCSSHLDEIPAERCQLVLRYRRCAMVAVAEDSTPLSNMVHFKIWKKVHIHFNE